MFDLLVLGLIALLAFLGGRKGLVGALLKLGSLFIAGYTASRFYHFGGNVVNSLFNASEGVRTILGFAVIFLIIFLFIELIGVMLRSLLRGLKLVWLDRAGGALFGIIGGLGIIIVLIWFINVFPELSLDQTLERDSGLYRSLNRLEERTVSLLNLEQELSELQISLRKIFMLPALATPEDIFHPDTSGLNGR